MMNTKINLVLLFLFVSVNVIAQKSEMQTITENDLKAHLEFVASDYLQGRDFNSTVPGLEITANYLKAQCTKMGLKPGVDGFFQKVEMVSVIPDLANTSCKLLDKTGNEIYSNGDIFSLGGSTKSDTITGDIVFAGYGWYNDETKYNDTDGLDIKGKVVLVMTRNLELAKEGGKVDPNIEMKKMQKALMGGAKALILVPDPMDTEAGVLDEIKKYANGGMFQLKDTKARPFVPITLIVGSRQLGNEIVKESGKTLADFQNEINESGAPKSFELKECTAKIQLAKITKPVDGQNVIAIVEGSDPVLKNECVVISAHYDHVGVDENGEVYNGADDNGTGTVALLEIAEAFQTMKKKPKRSIVFAWVTAEEKGLFGSSYYSQNPVIPLANTLANINLDMVGRSAEKEPEKGDEMNKQLAGPNGLYIVSGKQSSELMKISDEVCEELGLIPSDELTKAFLTRSDYYHFYKNGIPILGLSTGMHDDYHKTTDEIDKIDFTKMKRVAQYAFLVADKVANQKARIKVDNTAE
ncbi:M20/M25/M40 family metallo-hydrolase [Prolixibacteraceae bacterium Z1-6]|uniref:M20/M25/M40 family metallo-hydrolase n=1 Tax=Draconibacterium aestuarii TaxID=2998507 RepID=A0A9X3J6C7_9BACT|nr:M20/M25/M40 family metallo-hydrolase [Prolixibacteraceae bacterium Z1-6]